MGDSSASAGSGRSRYRAPAAGCAAGVLLQLMEHGGALSLAELSRRLAVSKSLVFRVLRELEARDFVEQVDDGRYWLGLQSLAIGATFNSDTTYGSIAGPILNELATTTRAEAWLGVLRGSQMIALLGYGGHDSVVRASYVGARLPANCTAMGKALLATLPNSEVRTLLGDSLPSLTSRSIADPERLIEDLERTRARGYAVQDEEAVLGSSGLAAVISLRLPNATQASISISMGSDVFPGERGEALESLLHAKRLFDEAAGENGSGAAASAGAVTPPHVSSPT
jgi:DNA-binding IclR family transcriptional regulator